MRHAIPRPRPPDNCCKTTAPSNRAYCVHESRYVRTLPVVVVVLALGLQSTPPHEQSLRRKNKQLLVANIRDRGKWRPDCGGRRRNVYEYTEDMFRFVRGTTRRGTAIPRGARQRGRLSRRESAVDRSHCSAEEGEGSGEGLI